MAFKVASANVKALDPAGARRAKKLGLNTSSKMEYLDGALAAAGYDIVGVQESCVGGDVTREQAQYVVYTSGASLGGVHLFCANPIQHDLCQLVFQVDWGSIPPVNNR